MNGQSTLQSLRADKVLDLRGLNGPIPLSKTANALKRLSPGKVLEVWSTDREFRKEFSQDGCCCQYPGFLGCMRSSEGYMRYFFRK